MKHEERKDIAVYINLRAGFEEHVLGNLVRQINKEGVRLYARNYLDEMKKTIESFSPELKRLVVVGGDGTILRIINALASHRGPEHLKDIVLIPIAAGTVNRLPKEFGWSNTPLYNFKLVLQAIKRRCLSVVEMPILKVSWGEETVYCITFFAGPPIRVLEHYNQYQTTPFIAALFAMGSIVAGLIGWPKGVVKLFEPICAKVEIDGKEMLFDHHIAISMNAMPQLLPGVYPYQGECRLGEFLALDYGLEPRETIYRLPLIMSGLPPTTDGRSFNQPSRKMVIGFLEDTKVTLDGEISPIQAGTQMTIENGPVLSVAINPNMRLRAIDGVMGWLDYQETRLARLTSLVWPTKK